MTKPKIFIVLAKCPYSEEYQAKLDEESRTAWEEARQGKRFFFIDYPDHMLGERNVSFDDTRKVYEALRKFAAEHDIYVVTAQQQHDHAVPLPLVLPEDSRLHVRVVKARAAEEEGK